jgi:hypothetical protein
MTRGELLRSYVAGLVACDDRPRHTQRRDASRAAPHPGPGRDSKQVDGGPHWITGCPTEDHIAPVVRWDQHADGKVTVHPCVKGCTTEQILTGLAITDNRIRAYSPNGSDPFTKPRRLRTGGTPPGDGLAIYEKLRAALDDGYDDGRGRTGRYQCPACGARGDGHGLKVDYDPNRNRRILLLCFQGCPVDEILEPLGMTKAELCADDDTDDLGEDEVPSTPVEGTTPDPEDILGYPERVPPTPRTSSGIQRVPPTPRLTSPTAAGSSPFSVNSCATSWRGGNGSAGTGDGGSSTTPARQCAMPR